jgi:anti-sigma B factor antagonist
VETWATMHLLHNHRTLVAGARRLSLLTSALRSSRRRVAHRTVLPYNISPVPLESLVIEREPGMLRLKGPLTTENLALFQSAVRREDANTVILDLTGVPYVDSAGLGSLITAHVSWQKAGRRVVLSGVNSRVLKLFQITKTESLFLIFPTPWEAIEALTNAGQA